MCVEHWGKVISERLRILEVWALRQGLELAAECHLSKINQCADFLMVKQSRFFGRSGRSIYQTPHSCYRHPSPM